MVTLNSDVDINLGGPLVNASAVIGHQGWLAGYQAAFDTSKSKLTKNNFVLGYSSGDFVLHTNVNDGQVLIQILDSNMVWARLEVPSWPRPGFFIFGGMKICQIATNQINQ